jgi:hypothetical protein
MDENIANLLGCIEGAEEEEDQPGRKINWRNFRNS